MNDEFYMQRCLELAKLGAGYVAPNPMVGAVLVHDERIIGEGWHKKYGEAHAEVNGIGQAVQNGLTDKLHQSTMYVSLEPCAHFGKTPPCTDLIIQHKIPKVVIGCSDLFAEVNGKGIEKLKAAGVNVNLTSMEMETECKELNKRFFTFYTQHRPYIILKWAQTGDGKIAASPELRSQPSPNPVASEGGILNSDNSNTHKSKTAHELSGTKASPSEEFGEASPSEGRETRLLISNEYSNRLVHQWRSEEAAILIGTNTAMLDNPELTTRLWPGPSPVRIVVDRNLKLPAGLKIFNQQARTIIFNTVKQEEDRNVLYYQLKNDTNLIPEMMNALYQLKIQSVLVEGGAKLLQSFIDEGIWDEARIITNEKLTLRQGSVNNGLGAPVLEKAEKIFEQKLISDTIEIYKPEHS